MGSCCSSTMGNAAAVKVSGTTTAKSSMKRNTVTNSKTMLNRETEGLSTTGSVLSENTWIAFSDDGYSVKTPVDGLPQTRHVYDVYGATEDLFSVLLYKSEEFGTRKVPSKYCTLSTNAKTSQKILLVEYPLAGNYRLCAYTVSTTGAFYGYFYDITFPLKDSKESLSLLMTPAEGKPHEVKQFITAESYQDDQLNQLKEKQHKQLEMAEKEIELVEKEKIKEDLFATRSFDSVISGEFKDEWKKRRKKERKMKMITEDSNLFPETEEELYHLSIEQRANRIIQEVLKRAKQVIIKEDFPDGVPEDVEGLDDAYESENDSESKSPCVMLDLLLPIEQYDNNKPERPLIDIKNELYEKIHERNIPELEKLIREMERHSRLNIESYRAIVVSSKRIAATLSIRANLLTTIKELKTFKTPKPILHEVIVATLLILGKHETTTRDWKLCKNLMTFFHLKPMFEKFSVKHLHPSIAARALEIVNAYKTEDIYLCSDTAIMLYKWIIAVTEDIPNIDTVPPADTYLQTLILGAPTAALTSKTATNGSKPPKSKNEKVKASRSSSDKVKSAKISKKKSNS